MNKKCFDNFFLWSISQGLYSTTQTGPKKHYLSIVDQTIVFRKELSIQKLKIKWFSTTFVMNIFFDGWVLTSSGSYKGFLGIFKILHKRKEIERKFQIQTKRPELDPQLSIWKFFSKINCLARKALVTVYFGHPVYVVLVVDLNNSFCLP